MLSFFKNLFSTVLGFIFSFIILIILITAGLSLFDRKGVVEVKEDSVLKIDFTKFQIVERASENPFSALDISGSARQAISLKQILDNLEKAKTDNNIKGLYLKSSSVSGGMSQLEEIRNKLLEFKNTGKTKLQISKNIST